MRGKEQSGDVPPGWPWLLPRGAHLLTLHLEFLTVSLHTNSGQLGALEHCPRGGVGGSPLASLAATVVSPGMGPIVPAKSHKSTVLTCCCEGRVHSYFSPSAFSTQLSFWLIRLRGAENSLLIIVFTETHH